MISTRFEDGVGVVDASKGEEGERGGGEDRRTSLSSLEAVSEEGLVPG